LALNTILEQYQHRRMFYSSEVWREVCQARYANVLAIMTCLAQAAVPLTSSVISTTVSTCNGPPTRAKQNCRNIARILRWMTRYALAHECGWVGYEKSWRLSDFGQDVLAWGSPAQQESPSPDTKRGVGHARKAATSVRHRKSFSYPWEELDPKIDAMLARGKRLIDVAQILGITPATLRNHQLHRRRAEGVLPRLRQSYDWTMLEPQVDALFATGMNFTQIALQLGIPPKTLKSHWHKKLVPTTQEEL
jgi:DNA-binding CsgD family transcriptional regulator